MKKKAKIRTRFAPSPTGMVHIGSARSALFPYLWAKKNEGDFILRIEDTDQSREVPGAVENIIDSLRWLGMDWQEGPDIGGKFGPYLQSTRLAIYKEHVEKLLKQGRAYRCFCTPERLATMRAQQQKLKQAPRYDRHCRQLSASAREKLLQKNTPHVIRLKVPEEGNVVVTDLLRGQIIFDAKNIDDQVLMKSDGYPTYHLANVVDDHLMEITHVIRGEDWLPSTPKHILLYEAFGWPIPVFVHLSLLLSKSGGKLSKRDMATAVLDFRDQGYLASAVTNFIAFLGWHPKTNEEFFSMTDLIKRFDLSMINTANPIVDLEKLNWFNQYYLRQLSVEALQQHLEELVLHSKKTQYAQFLDWFKSQSDDKKEIIWTILRARCTTLLDVAQTVQMTQLPEYEPTDLIWKKSTKETTITILQSLIKFLTACNEKYFTTHKLEKEIFAWIKESKWGNGDVLWPMRFALSGQPKSPPPFELAMILGKKETLERLSQALEKLAK